MSFVKVIDKGYKDSNALDDVCGYGENGELCQMLDGAGVCDCNKEIAIRNMKFIKKLYDQEDGKQLLQLMVNIYRYQFVKNQSEYKEKYQLDLEYTRMIAWDVEGILLSMGYQSCVYLHEDTDYIHLHFVVNSVNFKTGKKIYNTYDIGKRIYYYLKQNYSNLQWKGWK